MYFDVGGGYVLKDLWLVLVVFIWMFGEVLEVGLYVDLVCSCD